MEAQEYHVDGDEGGLFTETHVTGLEAGRGQ